MTERRAVALLATLIAALGALHLWLAGALQLAPDEAYYWTWSRDLGLGYPDHPPLVAWLVAAGTALLGDTELGVRLPFVLLGTGLIPVVWAIARAAGLAPGRALLVAAVAGTSPLLSAGALLATPETPLAFGWALGLLGLVRAAAGRAGPATWTLLGLGTAVALLAKLTGVLLPAIALAWLLGPDGRATRAGPGPWVALGAGTALAAPAWIADLGGGGATAFQLGHGLWAPGLGAFERLGNLAAYAGGQLGLLTPLIAIAVVGFLWRSRRAGPEARVLWWSAIVPWGAFALASPLAPPEANWPAVAHLGGLLGAALLLQRGGDRGARWSRAGWVATAIGIQVVAVGLLHAHVARPFLPLGSGEPPAFAGSTDPAARLHGWRELAAALARQGEPVVAGDYGIAAELEFYGARSPTPTPTLTGGTGGVMMSEAGERREDRNKEQGTGNGERGTVPSVATWVVVPVEGRGLPGRRGVGWPVGCVAVARSRVGVDEGLVHPAAPVSIVWADCAPRCAVLVRTNP